MDDCQYEWNQFVYLFYDVHYYKLKHLFLKNEVNSLKIHCVAG